ncbi:MAG: 2-amino-4-hydroxy-6-hydroxymethyldihydropteridine diphosphokinase [Zetaproteobacteria bacterium]|nr:2-amino-4-hydroxy-6-hydroxymethyldihydropteridine diphosphokinase [Zetaproteobacteria bacterium]
MADFQQQTQRHFAFRYLLAFGSNLGAKTNHCLKAWSMLQAYGHISASSAWITTPPMRKPGCDTSDHEDYLNFVIDFASDLTPATLYQKIVQIEDHIGHDRTRSWAPRKIDIDILQWALNDAADFHHCQRQHFYCKTSKLRIPHPAFAQREFWHQLIRDCQPFARKNLPYPQASSVPTPNSPFYDLAQ